VAQGETIVGEGKYTYRVAEGWEQLPEGWNHPDVASVAVDSRDRVFVFTRSAHPVIVYDREGRFLYSWGEGQFPNAHGITIGPDDLVYCVDTLDHTVRKFHPDGTLLMTIGTSGMPSDSGTVDNFLAVKPGAGPFTRPTNLAIAATGDLYVSDGYANAQVHCFAADGTLRMSWGEPGEGPGQFRVPHAIVVTPDNRVLVADRENNRIQIFSLDGAPQDIWTDFNRPDDITVTQDGTIFVVELGGKGGQFPFQAPVHPDFPPARCTILAPDGEVLVRWGSRDACAPGSFFAPHGVCLDSRGDLYVGEVIWAAGASRGAISPDCHTLQKFVRVG
jgi:DNA-binding beta-propeller fold protein YncE